MFSLNPNGDPATAPGRHRIKEFIHLLSLTLALSTFSVAYADPTTITFDNNLPPGLVPNSSFIEGSPVDADAQVTNQFANLGVTLSTVGGAPYAALIDLGVGHAPSGTNGIGAVNSAGNLDYAADLDIFLVVPGTNTPAVTDYIAIQGDEIPSFGEVFYTAYDVNGNLIASGNAIDEAGETYSLSAAGIHEFRLHSAHGDVAYDNLTFDTPAAPGGSSSATPEPDTLGLSGLVGAAVLFFRAFRRTSLFKPG
jgi:hypothetical protein